MPYDWSSPQEVQRLRCTLCGGFANADAVDESGACEVCQASTICCEWCGDTFNSNIRGAILTDEGMICMSCARNSCHCEGCDNRVSLDEVRECDCGCGNMYCDYCRDNGCPNEGEPNIHGHEYVPDLQFYGDGPLFMGVELEVDCGYDADPLIDTVGGEDQAWLKGDGSLSPRGIEIVSHPATLDYHKTKFPWKELIRAARDGGYTSHDAGNCGLHVHISRLGLGDSYEKRDLALSNLMVLFYRHWKELTKFSRRQPGQLSSWAMGNHLYKEGVNLRMTKHDLDNCKSGSRRYVAINCSNRNTIEFRMFRGTLRYGTLMATLELVDLMTAIATSSRTSDLYRTTWKGIRRAAYGYEFLPEYLETRVAIQEV
jgi:hypothetical protein